ncbi:hypothetical protein [Nocardioides sp. GY 10127]|uniref:hypothetical protein n=1 Tax=Nocardioides sp. GY 10127 TaxID=2569762 RepID=UPI0010A928AF|nr:hypothetical protein [Nocardioides sp. GY 10127]TIC84281.1 hypothetical protein E8D37_05755 [Nocardioides sp. GY 10127]
MTDPRTPADPTQVERFHPTSGRLLGSIGLAICVLLVLLAVLDAGVTPEVAAVAALIGVLAWATMLKPRLRIEGPTLVLVNAFDTVRVPLAGIRSALVQQVLIVVVGERKVVSPAVGRSWRQAARKPRRSRELAMSTVPGEGLPGDQKVAYADFVEQRIADRAREEQAARGVTPRTAEQDALESEVERTPAWLEIGLLVVAVVVLVVTLLV